MKKYILLVLIVGVGFCACNNKLEKEIGEVDSLLMTVKDAENSLFSVDTSRVFTAKRQMEKDLAEFNRVNDTLTKEESFKIADIFGNKKKLFRLKSNYPDFIRQIEFSKTQLNNLKKDLENGLITKDEFKLHFATEEAAVMELGSQINKSINGLEVAIQKLELDRPELLKILEERKQKSAKNE